MNNQLQIFKNNEFGQVRGILINDEPYFIGKEVAEVLGYANSKDAIQKHVDEEDKQIIQRSQFATLEIPNRGLTIINESGLYSLILSSKLPNAKKFKRWVTSEVLPQIRKTGGYLGIDNNMTEDDIFLYFQELVFCFGEIKRAGYSYSSDYFEVFSFDLSFSKPSLISSIVAWFLLGKRFSNLKSSICLRSSSSTVIEKRGLSVAIKSPPWLFYTSGEVM